MSKIAIKRDVQMYFTGGTVRDLLLGNEINDLDITIANDAFGCARMLSQEAGGSFVPLDAEEDVARVVWNGFTIDFASFREETISIEEDLLKRDFSINALAVEFYTVKQGILMSAEIIDPAGGQVDLKNRTIRCTSNHVFESDPLRLLRAYRFKATLDFSLDPETEKYISANAQLISKVSAERISYELKHIMISGRAFDVCSAMKNSGLLWHVFPELKEGVGVDQPASHHLDVFDHGLETLDNMEKILHKPGHFFPGYENQFQAYLAHPKRKTWLTWAALFHDIGKPETHMIRDDGGRITFYNHDHVGSRKFREIADRLRWSREDTKEVCRLISMHMWPFHLNNARKKDQLTPKAYLRIVKAAEEELDGLFLLALADSLAGKGIEKPLRMEAELFTLYTETKSTVSERIEPVLVSPPLLRGKDLIELGLVPGPLFSMILDDLEKARVEKQVNTKKDALKWVKNFIKKNSLKSFTEDKK